MKSYHREVTGTGVVGGQNGVVTPKRTLNIVVASCAAITALLVSGVVLYGRTRAVRPLAEAQRTIEELATRDALTGILNRHGLELSAQVLHDEGVLLLKYWFHLSKAQQKQGEFHGVLPRAEDQQVQVSAGNYTQVTITFDSGIR